MIDTTALAAVPKALLDVPVLPPGMVWECPISDCNHFLDFNTLSGEAFEKLPQELSVRLSLGKWTRDSSDFVDLFEDMVEGHYIEHLRELGVQLKGWFRDKHPDAQGRFVRRERILDIVGENDGVEDVTISLSQSHRT